MSAVPFLLRALKYPRVEGFSPEDPAHLQAAVVWLENTKVRRYPIDGRGALQSADPAAWQAALAQYLADLECPVQPAAGRERAVLQWLLSHAVGLEYQDQAQQLTELSRQAEAEAGPPEEWTEAQLPPFPDITSEGVKAALVELQQLLHADGGQAAGGAAAGAAGGSTAAAAGSAAAAAGGGEASAEALQRAHAMLETCVLPALGELARQRAQQAGQHAQQGAAAGGSQQGPAAGGAAGGAEGAAVPLASSQHAAVAAMLAQYPLGFSTGDPGADLAATILRMLYIKDLRALQTLVDSAIVQVQEYTANPRTDASLGKVGR